MRLRLISILSMAFLLCLVLTDASNEVFADCGQAEEYQDELIGMANPAAVYCIEMGYEYGVINEPSGQRGVCIFTDGTQCDAWAFLQGKCGQNYSHCAKCGYAIETLTDGKNPFSREYAVCVSKEGNRIGSVTELMGLSEKATKASVRSESSENERVGKQSSENIQVPPSFDWKDHNGHDWMTPVKNQGICGSCWAFAGVGVVEAWHNIWRNDPDLDPDLSEQYLVSDCYGYGNCCGGNYLSGLAFASIYAIPDEDCLSYVDGSGCSCSGGGCDTNCEHNCSDVACSDRCSDWQNRLVKMDSAKYLSQLPIDEKECISGKGPVATSMFMSGYWDGDIYRCETHSGYGHAVVIAGYDDAGGYWIVKNSWGTGFGENGYFKVGYGECSIQPPVILHYTDEVECGCLITKDIVLDHDIVVNCGEYGLEVGRDSIVLDCNGHVIDGSGFPGSHGSGICLRWKNGVTVRNCNVTGFYRGIFVERSSNNDISGNYLVENAGYGVYLYGHQFGEASFNTLWGNVFADNGSNAVELGFSNNNEWNLADIGNQWSDFESNVGYPDSYVVSGPGDGVDYYASQYVDVVEDLKGEESLIPRRSSLTQNYPNPFNPTTTIQYTLPKHTWVRITIYNILGKKVRTLVDEYQLARYRRIVWDSKDDEGREVGSGIYFYQIKAGEFTQSKKMAILK